MAVVEHTEHGLIVDGKYLCSGCNVRPPHEHRCHRSDAAWADERQVCTCPECAQSDGAPIRATISGWTRGNWPDSGG